MLNWSIMGLQTPPGTARAARGSHNRFSGLPFLLDGYREVTRTGDGEAETSEFTEEAGGNGAIYIYNQMDLSA